MVITVLCVAFFGLGLTGAHGLRQRGHAIPKWPLVATSALAMLAMLLVRA
ncbi:hypothetical protein [Methylobacterium sp. CM6257]|jgi:hypothetical protein